MVKETQLKIQRDELLYLNSRQKLTRRKPQKCLGGFYYLEVIYEEILYRKCRFIADPLTFWASQGVALRARLFNEILFEINKRGACENPLQ